MLSKQDTTVKWGYHSQKATCVPGHLVGDELVPDLRISHTVVYSGKAANLNSCNDQ